MPTHGPIDLDAMKPGYRKFSVAVLSILLASGLMLLGRISDGVYSTIIVAVVGGYLAANVTQKATRRGDGGDA